MCSLMAPLEASPDPMPPYEPLTHEGPAIGTREAELHPHLSALRVRTAPTIEFERPRHLHGRITRMLAAAGASKAAIAGLDTAMLALAVATTVAISNAGSAQATPTW